MKLYLKSLKTKLLSSSSRVVKIGFILLWLFTIFLATRVSVEFCQATIDALQRGYNAKTNGHYTVSISCESIIETVTNEFEKVIEAKATETIGG